MVKKKYLFIIGLALGTVILLQIVARFDTYESPNLTPEKFPQKFNGWIGTDMEVSPIEKESLPGDTLFVKKYYNKPGFGGVFLVVVFSGQDRRSIHRPEVCYPSQGWSIQARSILNIEVNHPIKELKTTKLDISYGKKLFSKSEVVLYWFMGNNRVTATHLKRVLLMVFDRCTFGRNYRWAFLRASTEVTQEGEDQAVLVLEQFIKDLFPVIADKSFKQY